MAAAAWWQLGRQRQPGSGAVAAAELGWAQCWRGQDSAGSHYLLAKPALWSGVLVVHAHGGPALGEPKASRADEDIKRWAITLTEGHAWAGSVFRQGGFAVTTAAEDTERVRRIFVDYVAKPQRTLLHGQSWGAMVATRAAEMYPQSWEGILLTSGVVAGPTTYDFRLDLRAIYQHLCQNHPRPDEPQYPLSLGLPAGNPMTSAELTTRVNDCLGLRKPAAQRSTEQVQKIKTIVDVLKIPENSIAGHLNWGTFTLRDVVSKNGGASPFGNTGVRYVGSACPATPWNQHDAEWLKAKGVQVQFRASLEQDLAAMHEYKPHLAIGTTPLVQKAAQNL